MYRCYLSYLDPHDRYLSERNHDLAKRRAWYSLIFHLLQRKSIKDQNKQVKVDKDRQKLECVGVFM